MLVRTEKDRNRRRQEKNYTRLDKIEARRGGAYTEVFTVKCAFMYDIYGIVKVEYHSYNKGEHFVSFSHIVSPIKEPEDEHCVSWCTRYK